MHTFFQDYLDRLSDLHQGILNAIEGLPPEALDWTPLQETSRDMNSINVMVTHLCGAERYWIGEIACGERADRVRADEFEVHGTDAETLAKKVTTATTYAQAAIAKLSLDALPKEKSRLRDGRPVTAGWALLHALEHTGLHLGHIQITRQLWDESTR